MKKIIITVLGLSVIAGVLLLAHNRVFRREPKNPIIEIEKPPLTDPQGRILSTPENAFRGPGTNQEKNIISF